jgi:hypothetical protein
MLLGMALSLSYVCMSACVYVCEHVCMLLSVHVCMCPSLEPERLDESFPCSEFKGLTVSGLCLDNTNIVLKKGKVVPVLKKVTTTP